jgi:diphthamide biosynthesis protein 4
MSHAISRTTAEPTLYEILSLTPKHLEGQASAAQQKKVVKQAYHKALLKHHPDKNQQDSPSSTSPATSPSPPPKTQSSSSSKKATSSVPNKSQLTYTVDQILHAYNVLLDVRQRREYDRQLTLTSSTSAEQRHSVSTRFHTGLETVDLDDLGFDERTGVYSGPCRCGNERGFRFTEAELEEYEDDLVLMVQCLDCSLWLRVLFDAAEDDDQPPASSTQPATTKSPPTSSNSQNEAHHRRSAHEGGNGSGQTASTTVERQGGSRDVGSHSGNNSGKGWKFNFSFNWGISLAGSGSATSNRST